MKNWKHEKYQGWKNWYFWNIALYIDNTYPVYIQAVDLIQDYQTKYRNKKDTIQRIQNVMIFHFGAKTPDGARITKTAIKEWFDLNKDNQYTPLNNRRN